jgi:hypothetical protein
VLHISSVVKFLDGNSAVETSYCDNAGGSGDIGDADVRRKFINTTVRRGFCPGPEPMKWVPAAGRKEGGCQGY